MSDRLDMAPVPGAAASSDPTILMYHRVCPDDEWRPSGYAVAASVFREQLRYLSRARYYTPRLSEVLSRSGDGPTGGRRPIVLTFDDGYADTFEVAFPILREFGFTAAVFPVLDLDRRFSAWGAQPIMRAPLMTPGCMREMEAAGFEFGSHTMTHPRLTGVGEVELADELSRSREVLASLVARPLPVLAYPFGDVGAREKRAVQRSGYSAALATYSGPLEIRSDPFEIRRVCITNSASDAYMRFKTSGAAKVYEWAKWKARDGLRSTRSWAPSRQASGAP